MLRIGEQRREWLRQTSRSGVDDCLHDRSRKNPSVLASARADEAGNPTVWAPRAA